MIGVISESWKCDALCEDGHLSENSLKCDIWLDPNLHQFQKGALKMFCKDLRTHQWLRIVLPYWKMHIRKNTELLLKEWSQPLKRNSSVTKLAQDN